MTTSAGLNSSIAPMTWPTTSIVSAPLYRRIVTRSRPCRTAMTVLSLPNRAGSTPSTMGALASLYAGRAIASATKSTPMNWSSDAFGN